MTREHRMGPCAMHRLAGAALGVAAMCMSAPSLAQGSAPTGAMPHPVRAAASTARSVTPLSDGWRFLFGEAPDGVTGADFDDREWQPVSLPHSWNRMGNYTAHRADSTDVRQGTGW